MKPINALLISFCGLMTLFLGLVWINNVYLSWVHRVWMMTPAVASQFKGLFPLLDKFCIDHSTVATFIPFFGFGWLTWMFYRVQFHLRRNSTIPPRKEFPFFSGYNEWMVSLGLMGTVWGLIMIGYLPDLENLELTGLIGALRTALFSTLVALVWVYIVVLRFIRPAMRLYAEKTFKHPRSPLSAPTLQKSIEAFTANMEALNGAMAASTRNIDSFNNRLEATKWEQAEKLVTQSVEALQEIKRSGDQRLELMKAILRLSGERSVVEERIAACLDAWVEKKVAQTERDRKLLAGIVDVLEKYGRE